jgi:hypothetical protein
MDKCDLYGNNRVDGLVSRYSSDLYLADGFSYSRHSF